MKKYFYRSWVLLVLGMTSLAGADETGMDLRASDVLRDVALPGISGRIEVPGDWHVLTPEQAAQSLDKVEFSTPQAEEWGKTTVASVGDTTISISKYPEPYTDGVNPSLSINWVPMPEEFKEVPATQRNAVMAKVIEMAVIPTLQQSLGDGGFTVVAPPAPFGAENRHQGAQLTYRAPMQLKTGKIIDPVTRTFLLYGDGYLITVSLLLPENGGEPGDAIVLQKMLRSLEYARMP
jgi:hypothetical protein